MKYSNNDLDIDYHGSCRRLEVFGSALLMHDLNYYNLFCNTFVVSVHTLAHSFGQLHFLKCEQRRYDMTQFEKHNISVFYYVVTNFIELFHALSTKKNCYVFWSFFWNNMSILSLLLQCISVCLNVKWYDWQQFFTVNKSHEKTKILKEVIFIFKRLNFWKQLATVHCKDDEFCWWLFPAAD